MTIDKFYAKVLNSALLLFVGCLALVSAPQAMASPIGKADAVLPTDKTTTILTQRGVIRITPMTENIFRVTTQVKGDVTPYMKSQSAILEPNAKDVKVSASSKCVALTSPTTKVVVDKTTGLLSFYDNRGNLLLQEKEGVDNSSDMRRISFVNSGKEHFYGAGERGHSLELGGDTLVMYNRQNYGYTEGDPRISQMNITVPYFVSDKGYGVLFDDYNSAKLILGETIEYLSDTPAPLSYYFINGEGTIAGATEGYTLLTGRQELPPFWALGYITSKYGYHTQDEALGVVDTLKRRGYPVDGMVLDLYWYGKETDMGRLEWNKTQWPDHKKMLRELKENGVNMVIISQPYINKIGAIDNYNMLAKEGMLMKDADGNVHDVTTWVGDAGMFDVSNPKTRQWLWNRYKSLTEDGVEGWWGDLGEPEVHPLTMWHNNGQSASQYHNVYGNEWSRIIYEGFKKDFPDRRLMLLMRGGTAGLQRYNVFPWSTDVSRSWGGLQPQVKIMLNSSLSGLAYMSSDIGGFAVDPENPLDAELYVRWLQMGVFTPTFRTHAQLKPEPYHYPAQEKISKEFIKKRYEWLPYNYTLAYENATVGAPLARPFNFNGENLDEKYADIEDQYMWGDEMMIAPVMKKGARSRKVIFPEGKWINWNNPKQTYKGGSEVVVSAPLSKLPMFVREGAFIPQYLLPIENVTQYDPTFLTIKYFPAEEETSYTMFEDDRLSTHSLENGQYQLITFTGWKENNETHINIEATGGNGYESMPQSRMFTFQVEGVKKAPKSVEISNGMPMVKSASLKAIRQSGWCYDATRQTLYIVTPWDYTETNITIK